MGIDYRYAIDQVDESDNVEVPQIKKPSKKSKSRSRSRSKSKNNRNEKN